MKEMERKVIKYAIRRMIPKGYLKSSASLCFHDTVNTQSFSFAWGSSEPKV